MAACLLSPVFSAPLEKSTCSITHPTTGAVINLAELAGAGSAELHDYVAVSEKFPKYEYVFNVCDKLAYADDVCVEGSTVCDRSTSKLTTVTVYGQAEDQTLSYEPYKGNESQKELTLAYTAGECYYRPTKATSAKIFFFCDPLAFEPQISLNYEDYLECAVEINFATVVACGTDKLKYACGETGSCQASADGTQTFAECKERCHAPPPPPPSPEPTPAPSPAPPDVRYGCNPGVEPGLCYEATGGEFDDKESCDTSCKFIPHMYSCVAGEGCVIGAEGKFRSEAECLVSCGSPTPPTPPSPPPSPPPPPPPSPPPVEKHYECTHPEKKCVEKAGALYKNESSCLAGCKDPEPAFTCTVDFKCEEKLGGDYPTNMDCELKCKAPEDSYRCEENKCVAAPNGVSHTLCNTVCDVFNATKASKRMEPGYRCVDGRVTPSLNGKPRPAVHAACTQAVTEL